MITDIDKNAFALRVAKWMDEYAAGIAKPLWMYMGEAEVLASILREYAEGGWRDISTAPKDGTVILLFCPKGDGTPGNTYRVTAGNWESDPGGTTEYRDREGRWIDQDDRDGWEGWISWDGGFSEDTMMPTHWRPLPSPPQEQSK